MVKRILLDTNLLVLLVVGLTERPLIGKHKRTREYEQADYDLLVEILGGYERIVVTPHILAEVSNLASQIGDPALTSIRKTLAHLIKDQDEEHQPGNIAVLHSTYLRLGLTDAGILGAIASDMPMLTSDLDLYLAAAQSNPLAANFNHIRQARLLSPP